MTPYPLEQPQWGPESSSRALLRTGANVLAVGAPRLLQVFTETCRAELPPPVAYVSTPAGLAARPGGTVVISDVDRLDADGQRVLRTWLDDPGNLGIRVVSLATEPLFPLVQSGAFDRDLYYRLNTIYLRLDRSRNGARRAPSLRGI